MGPNKLRHFVRNIQFWRLIFLSVPSGHTSTPNSRGAAGGLAKPPIQLSHSKIWIINIEDYSQLTVGFSTVSGWVRVLCHCFPFYIEQLHAHGEVVVCLAVVRVDKGALRAVPADWVKYLQVSISSAHSQHFKYLYLNYFPYLHWTVQASCRLANGKLILRLGQVVCLGLDLQCVFQVLR